MQYMSDKPNRETEDSSALNDINDENLVDDFELGVEPPNENDLKDQDLLEHTEGDALRELDDLDEEFFLDSSESSDDEEDMHLEPVHAFVTNMTFPKTLDEVMSCARRKSFDIELLQDDEVWWTLPKYARVNDVVFFMHAVSAYQTIKDLEKQLKGFKDISEKKLRLLQESLDRGKELYKRYGGKIFAIGFVVEDPQEDDSLDPDEKHWRSNTYAGISDIWHLSLPVDISEFRDFLSISRFGSVTKVGPEQFEKLRDLIRKKNPYTYPGYLYSVRIKESLSDDIKSDVYTDQSKGECTENVSLFPGFCVENGRILNTFGEIIPDAPFTDLPLSARTIASLFRSRGLIQDSDHEDIMISDLLCQTWESLGNTCNLSIKSIWDLIHEMKKYLNREFYDEVYLEDLAELDLDEDL